MKITSPIIRDGDTKKIASIESKDIIDLYRKQSNIDVSRFFTNVESVRIYECIQTGYRFYYPFTLIGDGKFYADLQNIKMQSNVDYYRDWSYDNEFAFATISERDNVLEIGCGTGKFLERLKARKASFVGLELNVQAVDIAQQKGMDVRHELIEDFANYNQGLFTHVCAFQVLEHIASINSFISSSVKCLKSGGKLIFGVPNNEPYFQRFNEYETFNLPPHHMGLWNLKAFKNLADIFSLKFDDYIYEPSKGRVLADAYLRTKLWMGVKSLPRKHSFWDKAKMLAVSPFSVLMSFAKHITGGINGGYIVVSFTKN
jgi:2-polyprenyl-3-methyl-5-hydroxy-6-metoxy-1,4-benzoquinol methylase